MAGRTPSGARDLEAPASNSSLDVANWSLAAFERAKKARAPQLRESEEELAAQGDHSEVLRPGTLGALVRGGRGAPVSPKHFEEELKKKVFSYDSDRAVCAGLYRGVAEPLLAGVERLMFDGLPWTSDDWRHLGGVLVCCTKLRVLTLTNMGRDARYGNPDAPRIAQSWLSVSTDDMAALCGELGPGAAPALKVLDLSSNRIKDDGVCHLFKALARGAAPALESLNLLDSPIGRKGINALCSAFKRGSVPEARRAQEARCGASPGHVPNGGAGRQDAPQVDASVGGRAPAS